MSDHESFIEYHLADGSMYRVPIVHQPRCGDLGTADECDAILERAAAFSEAWMNQLIGTPESRELPTLRAKVKQLQSILRNR